MGERDASPDLHAWQDMALNKNGLPCAVNIWGTFTGDSSIHVTLQLVCYNASIKLG